MGSRNKIKQNKTKQNKDKDKDKIKNKKVFFYGSKNGDYSVQKIKYYFHFKIGYFFAKTTLKDK